MRKMHIAMLASLLMFLAGCQPQEADNPVENSSSSVPVDTPTPVARLNADDLVRVCKAGQAFTVGRSIEGMAASLSTDGLVRLSYTRDDGKHFDYDCMVEGNVIRTRMIDEGGPGTGPGAWSGRGSTTTFSALTPTSVHIKDVYFDGSVDEGTIEF